MSKKRRFHSSDKASPVEMERLISRVRQDMLKKLIKAGGGVL